MLSQLNETWGQTPLFSAVRIIICWSIRTLLAVKMIVSVYAASLLIVLGWAQPDSKSINYVPLASVLGVIETVFWAQSQHIKGADMEEVSM